MGGAWENLDVVDITGNTLVVELRAAPANGYVIADGVWVGAAAPLLAAAGEVVSARTAAPFSAADLQPIVHDALSRWAQIDLPAELVNKLKRTQFVVADLLGSQLGLAAFGRIYIDSDAAGHGWFIDSTPDKSEEFARLEGSRDLFSIDPIAADRIDLLTVVSHELGHIVGLDDLAMSRESLMNGALNTGVRRMVGQPNGMRSSRQSSSGKVRIRTATNRALTRRQSTAARAESFSAISRSA